MHVNNADVFRYSLCKKKVMYYILLFDLTGSPEKGLLLLLLLWLLLLLLLSHPRT